MNALARSVVPIGVAVEVPPKRLPTPIKLELQRELDRMRASLSLMEACLADADEGGTTGTLADDAVVDQRTVPAPADLFLRLARQGAFPSRKHGKRVVARWGDVKAAMLDAGPRDVGRSESAPASIQSDGLDGLRQRLGLASKGK